MKDMIGVDLNEGDLVILRTPNNTTLCIGKIIGFTSKTVRIKHRPIDGNPFQQKVITVSNRGPKCVFRISDQDQIAIILKDLGDFE